MADLSDIEQVIVSILTQTIYPNGTSQPSIASTGARIYRGWPIPANLDADLAAGVLNVSVVPTDVESKQNRYFRQWQPLPVPAPSLVVSTTATAVTLSGAVSSPLNVAVLVNGFAFVYPVQPSDTLTIIATALATLINASVAATSSGAVITIPAATKLAARVGGVGTLIREIKRQKRNFQITFWCSSPAQRDAVTMPCDAALSKLTFITLPDGTSGRIAYEKSTVTDRVEKAGLYRRDLFYSVEYATTDTQTAPQIVNELINISGGNDSAYALIKQINV